jgi:hypothetical protein
VNTVELSLHKVVESIKQSRGGWSSSAGMMTSQGSHNFANVVYQRPRAKKKANMVQKYIQIRLKAQE